MRASRRPPDSRLRRPLHNYCVSQDTRTEAEARKIDGPPWAKRPQPPTSFPQYTHAIPATPCRHSRVGGNLDTRTYDVPPAVRARRSVEPAAMSRPPARKSMRSRPPDMPAPPALGSSSGGTGVGVDVAVAVGTGVRVGVIVGGGVGVGVLVATMSYEPAAGGLVARGVGVRVGGTVACGVPACAVACGVAVRVAVRVGGAVACGVAVRVG